MAASSVPGSSVKQPTREQVRAWLSTVLGPMVDALRVEDELLAAGNPSFRAYTHSIDFELLWGSDRMISNRFRPNLEQFYRYYDHVRGAAARHDEALERLRDACAEAFKFVLESPRFAALCGGRPESERRALAQDVVNGVEEREETNPLASFWKQHASEFLALRSQPELRPSFDRLEQAKAHLQRQVKDLLTRASELQQALADEHGLPPVSAAGDVP
jgi:hypothetical protein